LTPARAAMAADKRFCSADLGGIASWTQTLDGIDL
jgi:hypothetical protein